MKKILVLLILAITFTSCNQSSKTAYVDMDKVIKEYDGFIKAEKEMKEKSLKISNDIQKISMQFQQKVQDYQQKKSKMNKSQAAKLEQQLMQEQQMIQQQQQMMQQQYREQGNVLFDKINVVVYDYIEDYAKKKGFDFILGTTNQTKVVLYGNEKLDVTQGVIDGLNSMSTTETKEAKESAEPVKEEKEEKK
jgi:outer membrane protein